MKIARLFESEEGRTIVWLKEPLLKAADREQVAPQVTPQVAKLIEVIRGEMPREAIQAALGLKDRKSFRELYLLPALEAGLIEMTIPDKPRSSNQKYRLTEEGRRLK